MFWKLHYELSKIDWEYHVLEKYNENAIVLQRISKDANNVNEVKRIKEMADRFFFQTYWDGRKIVIMRATE